MQLYDGEDRMGRQAFLREYRIDGNTERRARAEKLPWPPWIRLAGRIYYSKSLTARWFEQQGGADQVEAAETTDNDELAAVAGGETP